MWTCKNCDVEINKESRLLHLDSKECRKKYTDEEYAAFQEERKHSGQNKNVVSKTKY